MMIVCISRASFLHFLIPFWEKEAPGSWNCRYCSCHSTMTVTATKINLISEWFVMIVCSCSADNRLCLDLVWDWRDDWVWRECLVTRICTYTRTSRCSLVWFNEVLYCEVKSYFKSLELWLWAHIGCVQPFFRLNVRRSSSFLMIVFVIRCDL